MSEQRPSVLQAGVSLAEVRNWQRILLRQVMQIVFFAAIPALLFSSYYVWQDGKGWLIPFYVVGFVVVGIMQFWKKAPYAMQTSTLLIIIYMFAVLSLIRGGLSSNARVFLLAFIFVATIFLGRRAAIVSVTVAIITMGMAGWLFSTGRWVIPEEIQLVTTNPVAWATYTFILLMISAFFVLLPTYMLMHLSEALTQSRAMARELEADREQAQLEAQRKHNHAEQLGWAAALGHALTSMRQREDIVQRVVREIVRAFDIHQATLYLMARSGTVLNTAATAGDLGDELPQDEGAVPINARIAPARAAQIGREQMALLLPGELPRFPQSRVEISLPLSVRGEVLGVLDIHSLHPTFSEEELQIFRIVANHVAASLDVLRLLEESKARMQETQMLYTQHALASWRTVLESRNVQSFAIGKIPEAQVIPLAQDAMAAMQPRSAWLEDIGMYLLVVPLVANGIAVGYLAFTRTVDKGDWGVDNRDLISMAAERLAVALENARMLIDARQQLLFNERLGRLGDLIWQAPSPEAIMQQSVRELGRFLGASEVQLHLTPQGGARRGRGTQPLNPRAEQGETGNG